MNTAPSHLTVTGVSGHLGHRAAHHLLDQADGAVLSGCTRSPDRVADLAARGMALHAADFDDPASLDRALVGTQGLLLVSTGAEHAGPRRVRQHLNAIAAARRAGVAHVVYTSLQRADDSPLKALVADHAATEAALPSAHTVLRNAFYAEMLLTTLPPAIASGCFVTSAARGRIAYVTRDDCARAAAEALRQPVDGARCLDITGPDALDADTLVAVVNAELGTAIRVEHVDAPVRVERQVAAGVPRPMAELLAGLERGVAAGAMARVSRDVDALIGRPATPVVQFLRHHRELLLRRG